jgi:hypothetical protein
MAAKIARLRGSDGLMLRDGGSYGGAAKEGRELGRELGRALGGCEGVFDMAQ